MNWCTYLAAAVLQFAVLAPALAHDAGLSRGDLWVAGNSIELRLAFHQSDVMLATAQGTAGEWRTRLASGITLHCADGIGRDLPIEIGMPVADQGNGLATRVMATPGNCRRLLVSQPLLSDLLPGHRQVLVIHEGSTATTHLLAAGSGPVEIGRSAGGFALVGEGVHHILIGYDHLAFLAVLTSQRLTRQLALVVTAFTLAHSLTLGLAATGAVAPATGPIEALIALSIVIAGCLSLSRASRVDGAALAFGFGLIHGFGFASAFGELVPAQGAPGWLAVAQFNVGVELGQLAVGLPAAVVGFLVIKQLAAGLWLARAGALTATAAGAFWFVDRLVAL
jgi:HupE / UreJ protein